MPGSHDQRRKLSRRSFIAGALAAPLLLSRAEAGEPKSPPAPRTLDLHVHLFGVGDAESGCKLSPAITGGVAFQYLLWTLRVRQRAKTVDEGYVVALAEQSKTSGFEEIVVLAQDAAYKQGKPDWDKTSFYVPNDYLLKITGRFPGMIPCIGLNPDRGDAIEELERCVKLGAKILKIHPPTQGVDVADKKHAPFFRRCQELKVLVLVHTGHEHSAPVIDPDLANPKRLRLALDQGCTVVACHCGTGRESDKPDMLPEFLALVGKYPKLWGDTAVLGSFGRARDVGRLIADKPAAERLLHGSDFPFPCSPAGFSKTLSAETIARVSKIDNALRMDLALKEALGFGVASAERAWRVVHGI